MPFGLSKSQTDALTVVAVGIAAIGLVYTIAKKSSDVPVDTTSAQSVPVYGGSADPGSGIAGMPPVITYNIGDNGVAQIPAPHIATPDLVFNQPQALTGGGVTPGFLSDLLNRLSGGSSGCCQQAPATPYIALPPLAQSIPVPAAQIPPMPSPQVQSYPSVIPQLQRHVTSEGTSESFTLTGGGQSAGDILAQLFA